MMVSIANNGTLLPFQAIYGGQSKCLCPSKSVPYYDDVLQAGMWLEYSGTKTYWSNHWTMEDSVNGIPTPYFQTEHENLGLPQIQKALWEIDIWSVHHLQKCCGWMTTNHDNIILNFIPGGCTGVAQSCDVGIQHTFKHSIEWSYHESIVQKMLDQMKEKAPTPLSVNNHITTLCCRSMAWLWDAFNTINDPKFVKKVWNTHQSKYWI